MGSIDVREGNEVTEGQVIGRVGQVLEPARISKDSPEYIRRLKDAANECMLHLEVYADGLIPVPGTGDYLGGNWFSDEKPPSLLDAGEYLSGSIVNK